MSSVHQCCENLLPAFGHCGNRATSHGCSGHATREALNGNAAARARSALRQVMPILSNYLSIDGGEGDR